ncbi:peptidoglycan DD-metalloendopeptidase family protein [Sphaerotilus uruguayifluvii]|uniref:Lipoprotein NlpD n=1 Tax=Sphaerotilus uruguayifluvii TaxID=2735897 RepID=A0ABX2G5Z8_9BURK|nr:peptidoglycan DD-metalloendopeptidase family protein [Leptothrix sp. C29]NRT57753.1 lipoprotein NlpD [Leptothrix sp. C29]
MTTPYSQVPGIRVLLGSAIALALTGCASHLRPPAPLENRTPSSSAARPAEPERLPPGHENAGKPGYYTVKPGDTLIRIGLETGQNWRDLSRWNQLENADRIEVGQVLRVVSPSQDPTQAASRPVVTPRIEPKPIAPPPPAPAAGATAASGAASAASAPAATPAPPPPPAPPAPAPQGRDGDDDVNWMWPAQGSIVSSFEDTRNKGVAIAGKEGDPVYAAADGRVVYAGSGLRGYGNLIIIKHNDTLLTAYAHNKTLLVREDQVVRRGQKIAEMGSSDTDRVKLHFEVRRKGKPVDPTKVLPSR